MYVRQWNIREEMHRTFVRYSTVPGTTWFGDVAYSDTVRPGTRSPFRIIIIIMIIISIIINKLTEKEIDSRIIVRRRA